MGTRSITVPIEALVRRAEPDFYKKRRKELEFEFSNGRKFYRDPNDRGLYALNQQAYSSGYAEGYAVGYTVEEEEAYSSGYSDGFG